MAPIGIALRRTLLLLLLAAGVGAAVSWWRGQSTTAVPAAPPHWPPLPEREAPPGRSHAALPDESVDAPESAQTWVSPHGDGSAPESHPVKAKVSSGIFHEPGGRFYDRTRADRCYPTAAAAEADGYRRSKT
jgi:hypothetical protein